MAFNIFDINKSNSSKGKKKILNSLSTLKKSKKKSEGINNLMKQVKEE